MLLPSRSPDAEEIQGPRVNPDHRDLPVRKVRKASKGYPGLRGLPALRGLKGRRGLRAIRETGAIPPR